MPRYKRLTFLGFPDYRVGDDGTVWSRLQRRWEGGKYQILKGEWRKLKPSPGDARGYRYVNFRTGPNRKKMYAVHTLVLLAFVGPKPTHKHQARHFPNRDPSDNRVQNLSWGTSKENHADQQCHGTRVKGETHPRAVLTDEQVKRIRELHAKGKELGTYHHKYGTRRLAKMFSISSSQAWRIVAGKSR